MPVLLLFPAFELATALLQNQYVPVSRIGNQRALVHMACTEGLHRGL